MESFGSRKRGRDFPDQYRDNPYPSPSPPSEFSHSSIARSIASRGGMHAYKSYGAATDFEHRILVDVDSFPLDSNVIMQILGPRGRHQQRMKAESDAIVTTAGKGIRGKPARGEEPLQLVIRSRIPGQPLTRRQIAVVHELYEDIMRNVKEYVQTRLSVRVCVFVYKSQPPL